MAKKYRYTKAAVKSKQTFTGRILGFAFVLLLIYALASLVSQQSQIAAEKEKIATIKTQIAELQQENDEYARLLSSEDEGAYMQRIAIERLGYAYPNERRFYIIESGTITENNDGGADADSADTNKDDADSGAKDADQVSDDNADSADE